MKLWAGGWADRRTVGAAIFPLTRPTAALRIGLGAQHVAMAKPACGQSLATNKKNVIMTMHDCVQCGNK